MNKYIKWYICVVLTFLITFIISFQVNVAISNPVLKKGMSGTSVTILQKNLKELGYFSLEPTGYYGDVTEAAIIEFQRKYGLDPDGKAGANTFNKINMLLNRTDPIKIVVDPGHGGIDSGASKGNVVESEVVLSIAIELKAYLEADGYDVKLTRSEDTALDSLSDNGKTRQERDLNARTNIIDESGAKLFVSIHVDSYPESPSTTGSTVYYNDKYAKSRELAQNIQKELNSITAGGYKRQTHNSLAADYYVLRNSHVPGVLIETGFITNTKERKLLATDDFRKKITKAILTGIENTEMD